MKKFNVTGVCVPSKDYMVDISGKIEQIKKLVERNRHGRNITRLILKASKLLFCRTMTR